MTFQNFLAPLLVSYLQQTSRDVCTVQFFAYKMTVASENSMLKHRNVDLNTVSLKASDYTVYCTV
jgi:hypothetical protein